MFAQYVPERVRSSEKTKVADESEFTALLKDADVVALLRTALDRDTHGHLASLLSATLQNTQVTYATCVSHPHPCLHF